MDHQKIADGDFLLTKYPGKGGWIYVTIPAFDPGRKVPFGMLRVKGMIDSYPLSRASIWKMKSGEYFFPVKAAIRKKIGKDEGDTVHIVIEIDQSELELPEDVLLCLKEEPAAYKKFKALTKTKQQAQITRIITARNESVRVERIAALMNELLKFKS
jgi:hypothetical protein